MRKGNSCYSDRKNTSSKDKKKKNNSPSDLNLLFYEAYPSHTICGRVTSAKLNRYILDQHGSRVHWTVQHVGQRNQERRLWYNYRTICHSLYVSEPYMYEESQGITRTSIRCNISVAQWSALKAWPLAAYKTWKAVLQANSTPVTVHR